MKIFFVLMLLLLLSACSGENGFNSSEEIGGEITVYTFDGMLTGPFLEEAAQLFMELHENVTVNVRSFSSSPEVRRAEGADGTRHVAVATDTPRERRDYVNMINTELMGGRGPDILALDVLPFEVYARNGQLADLREFMAADDSFTLADYRTNIFDALTNTAGQQFIFPVTYSFRYLVYDSSLVSSENLPATGGAFNFADMMETGRSVETGEFIFGMGAGPRPGLFIELFNQNSHFVDADNRVANFGDGVFEALLTEVYALEEDGRIPPRQAQQGGMGAHDERFMFKPRPVAMLLNEFQREAGRQGTMMAMGAGLLGIQDDDRIAGIIANANGEIPFTVQDGFGINSNSQNQHTAWEFLKFLSSDAVRQSSRIAGLPVHVGAFEERAFLSVTGAIFGEGDEPDSVDLEILAAYVAKVEYFTSRLTAFFSPDAIITDIVIAEVGEFFDGSRTAQDIADTLQSRITLLLNE